MKIGQKILIDKDFEIESGIGKEKIQVRKGDIGFINSHGMISYITGGARGKIQSMKDTEVKGYDHANIARLIINKLRSNYSLDDFIYEQDIDPDDLQETVEETLMGILWN